MADKERLREDLLSRTRNKVVRFRQEQPEEDKDKTELTEEEKRKSEDEKLQTAEDRMNKTLGDKKEKVYEARRKRQIQREAQEFDRTEYK